jgi:Glyoxalase-like domain
LKSTAKCDVAGTNQRASFELDHVFVCASLDGTEAAQLQSLGLTLGPSRVHPGQGTANRCFLFRNAYLELLWVHDKTEARSALTQRTRLFERWQGRSSGTCPFGICLRPASYSPANDPPFAGWDYVPSYVPSSRPIHVGNNSERLDEPMLFFAAGATRPDSWPPGLSLEHRLGVHEVTRLTWIRPAGPPVSPELQTLVDIGLLHLEPGRAHALKICFDNEAWGRSASLLPHLAITLGW